MKFDTSLFQVDRRRRFLSRDFMAIFSSKVGWRALLCASFLLAPGSLHAQLKLPGIFSEHMMLQAGRETAAWGWAAPGAEVKVEFLNSGTPAAIATATAGADGKWSAKLPAIPTKTKGEYKVTSKGEEKLVRDVLVGEVWFASGQSNMAYQVAATNVPPDMVAAAAKLAEEAAGEIRIFTTGRGSGEDVKGEWTVVDAQNVGKVSAVPFYFAESLREKLRVPVGVVRSAVGGSFIEPWIGKDALEATLLGQAVWQRHVENLEAAEKEAPDYAVRLAAWQAAHPTIEEQKKNRATQPREPYSEKNLATPASLYKALVQALVPYTVQGVIWYQGESNAGRPAEYKELIRTLITSWRKAWGAELPFYYVELASYTKPQQGPVQLATTAAERSFPWCYIREGQEAALALPKTGVATAIDLGVAGDIHPVTKRRVGQRLAGLALADVYAQSGLVRSPELSGFTVEDGKIRIKLRYADGLKVRGTEGVKGFAIAGVDKKWVWADAEIDGQDVIVSSKEIAQPVAVRYAWASNPVISLENASGLPLRPFRTDKDSAE